MEKEFNYVEHYKTDAEEFDYFETRTGATQHDERRLHEYIISRIKNNNGAILDVGCGSAWVAAHFLKQNFNVYSLDISFINPKKALNKYPSNKHSGITADCYDLPFKNNSFDIIIASEIIEHLLFPDKFAASLFRTLKPGGNLIITTPYKEVIKYYLCIHCNRKTPVNAHLHSFDENILANLYKSKDLESVKWETFGNKLLIFLRTYVLLKFLPFRLWKMLDKIVNLFYNNTAHIILIYRKEAD